MKKNLNQESTKTGKGISKPPGFLASRLTPSGSSLVFGVPAIQKPFVLPAWFGAAKVRLRFRPCEIASAVVRTATGIQRFLLRDEHYYLTVDERFEIGANTTCHLTRSSPSVPSA
jgi:hypothetical protein